MSSTVTVAGTSYSVPNTGDSNWDVDLTNLFIALSTSTKILSISSNSFPITQDVQWGSTYGHKAAYYKSLAANPSATGQIRLGNAESVGFRNAANNADLLLSVNASNILQFNGSSILMPGLGSIVNADVNASAAIAYSKLNLSGAILNADINSSAAIAYSKLNLATSILNADINGSAAIAYSKLNLSGSILNADINSSAAIAYSKLNLTGAVLNADLAGSIANSKLATMAANTVKANVTGGAAVPTDVSLVSAATVSTVPIRDANGNIQLNNLIENGQSIASAAGTTTLVVGSPYFTQITGSTTQTVVLPAANTLTLYQSFCVGNRSSGNVTVNANGGGLLQLMLGGSTQATFTCTNIGSGAGSWDVAYSSAGTTSPLTTKGDVYVYSTINARQPVPSDYAHLIADSAQTTGWRSLDYKVSRGLKNYVQYGDFENNATTGWTATGCATITNGLPVTVGSGAAAFSSSNGGRTKNANTNSPAIDSSSALSGTYAMNLATTGAGAIGDGYISSAYTIDPSDQAKVLSFKFNYKVASGTPVLGGTSANTYAVAIYDMVNNSWIIPAGCFNLVQSSGVGIAQGTFQTASNTTGIQIFIYSPVAPTGTSSLLFDDVYIGPQSLAFGPAMNDWVAYTPTFTGFGTVSSVAVYSRRVGGSLEVQGNFVSGTPTGVTAKITLGYNGANANVTLDSTLTSGIAGIITASAASTTLFGGYVFNSSGSNNYVTFSTQTSTTTIPNGAPINGNSLVGTGTTVSFQFSVPIVGWSSNSVQSADTDTRVVAATFQTTTSTIANGGTDVLIPYNSISLDTHGAATSGASANYVIPVTGYYYISAVVNYAYGSWAINDSAVLKIKNGTTVISSYNWGAPATTSYAVPLATATIVKCNAGDIIRGYLNTTRAGGSPALDGTAAENSLNIMRLSGPAVVAQSESVNCSFSMATAQTLTSAAIIKFDTKIVDSHNAYSTSTGIWTCPVSGTYQITSQLVSITATAAWLTYIRKNSGNTARAQSLPLYSGGTAILNNQSYCLQTPYILKLNAGDTIDIYNGSGIGTGTLYASALDNYMSILRVGN